jgi:hypothetical protein
MVSTLLLVVGVLRLEVMAADAAGDRLGLRSQPSGRHEQSG